MCAYIYATYVHVCLPLSPMCARVPMYTPDMCTCAYLQVPCVHVPKSTFDRVVARVMHMYASVLMQPAHSRAYKSPAHVCVSGSMLLENVFRSEGT